MKVLFVFDNHEVSGADKAAVNLMRHASRAGRFEARGVVCMDNRLAGLQEGVQAEQLSAPQVGRENFLQRFARGVVSLPKLARHCEWADIVVPVSPPAALWAAMAGAWRSRPVAPWVHYDLDGLAREGLHPGRKLRDWLMLSLYKHLIPSFHRLVFVSERTRASFVRRGGNSKNWIVLPNVYERSGFSAAPSTSVAKLGVLKREGLPLLLVVGRVFRQKRWEDAVAAAEALRRRGRRFHMAFIGDGLEMPRLRERVAASPAADSLHVLGADPNAVAALALGDALVMPSLYEAWPLVILECFDLGVRVFAYDCPSGPSEMLGRSGERGFLVRESAQDMADALDAWFWALPQAERERRSTAMDVAARAFLEPHLPNNALAAWESGLARLLGRAANAINQ